MMNSVHLIGRLGQDPESRETSGGTPVVNASLAVSKRIKGGEEQTLWVRLIFWDRLAGVVSQYCHKGSRIAIVGELQIREYVKNGETKTSTEVRVHSLDLLDPKPSESSGYESERSRPSSEPRRRPARSERAPVREPGSDDDLDDDIPF